MLITWKPNSIRREVQLELGEEAIGQYVNSVLYYMLIYLYLVLKFAIIVLKCSRFKRYALTLYSKC